MQPINIDDKNQAYWDRAEQREEDAREREQQYDRYDDISNEED